MEMRWCGEEYPTKGGRGIDEETDPAGSARPSGRADRGRPRGGRPARHTRSILDGRKEVPGPGDKDGRGEADVKVYKAKVCYELEVERIKPATSAHIHRGGLSVAGPIVVELKAPTDGSSEGCKAISKKLREHPWRYYVNVHNDPYPEGAIRGQLHRDD